MFDMRLLFTLTLDLMAMLLEFFLMKLYNFIHSLPFQDRGSVLFLFCKLFL